MVFRTFSQAGQHRFDQRLLHIDDAGLDCGGFFGRLFGRCWRRSGGHCGRARSGAAKHAHV